MLKNILLLAFILGLFCWSAFAQAYIFTYQGKLNDSGAPANGLYDIRITQLEAIDQKTGSDTIFEDVQVTNGIFTVNVTTGALILIENRLRFLEIGIRPGASTGSFTVLSPRQPVYMVPYAGRSATAAEANYAVVATTITDILPIEKGGTGSAKQNFVDLTTDQTVLGNKTFTGNISGNGAGITNINGANISQGSVTSNQLSPEAAPNSSAFKQLGMLRWDLLKPQASFTVGSQPTSLAFDGTNIWVANISSNNVMKLRASDGVNLGTFAVPNFPAALAFDGANIWVARFSSANVTKLRASDGANLGDFNAGTNPRGVVFDGSNIWVVNNGSNNVTKLRANDGSNLGTFPVGSSPHSAAFDGANIWVTNLSSNNVTKLRASDGSALGTFTVANGPGFIAFDGSSIWISHTSGQSVSKLRPSDGVVLGTFTVGGGPSDIVFDGANVWVVSLGSGTVTKLRSSDGSNLGTFSVPGNPAGAAFDGSNIWVGMSSGSIVTRLFPAFPQP